MSDTLRIALVVEGVTDYEVLNAVIEAMLGGRSYVLTLLQPEGSIAFTGAGHAGEFGGGWRGVYRWCLQATQRGSGHLKNDPLFGTFDILIIHLDADVAGEEPANYPVPILELAGVLPCESPCPPASDTTDRLRRVILGWVGESQIPPKTVFCTPSKSIEAWVLAAVNEKDKELLRMGWECHPSPEDRLSQLPKKIRFRKSQADYRRLNEQIQREWPRIVKRLSEAGRFHTEFNEVLG